MLRFIGALIAAGATKVTRPACPGCHRLIALHRRINEKWLCRNCVAKTRAVPCAGCGVVREPATRDKLGRPLCPDCFIRDPSNLETCIRCGRLRPVSVRTPDGPRRANGFQRTAEPCGRVLAGSRCWCAEGDQPGDDPAASALAGGDLRGRAGGQLELLTLGEVPSSYPTVAGG